MSGPTQAHDLVYTADLRSLQDVDGGALPPAAAAAAAASTGVSMDGAWSVVRRAFDDTGCIPVGLRGLSRTERYAARLPRSAVEHVMHPSEIYLHPATFRRDLPAFAALRRFESAVNALGTGWRWGPVGSVGFELVTGQHVTTASSDLDVLIEAPVPFRQQDVHHLLDDLRTVRTRLDVQINAPRGAFSLAEWVRQPGAAVALRTKSGPRLTTNPWADHR